MSHTGRFVGPPAAGWREPRSRRLSRSSPVRRPTHQRSAEPGVLQRDSLLRRRDPRPPGGRDRSPSPVPPVSRSDSCRCPPPAPHPGTARLRRNSGPAERPHLGIHLVQGALLSVALRYAAYMSLADTERNRAAVHEAGHAVVAAARGLGVAVIELHGIDGEGGMRLSEEPSVLDRIWVLYGGPLAEKVVFRKLASAAVPPEFDELLLAYGLCRQIGIYDTTGIMDQVEAY